MLTIRKFNELTKDLPNNYKIKMSCFDKEYTFKNPNVADNGTMHFDGSGIDFYIDFNNINHFTLGDFRLLLNDSKVNFDLEITSFDVDDSNTIEFYEVLVDNEFIILL
jgi:hypothetical protein